MTKKYTAWNSTLPVPGKPPERRTPLRSNSRLKRTPIRPVNPERRARLRENQYGDYAEQWIRGWPCHVCGRPSVAAHARKTRGAGGEDEHLNRLCIEHEQEIHRIGVLSFERKYDLDLALLAWRLFRDWNSKEDTNAET